jgi:hypothetical protein
MSTGLYLNTNYLKLYQMYTVHTYNVVIVKNLEAQGYGMQKDVSYLCTVSREKVKLS